RQPPLTFPTRRSSDLEQQLSRKGGQRCQRRTTQRLCQCLSEVTIASRMRSRHVDRPGYIGLQQKIDCVTVVIGMNPGQNLFTITDRKSTRLNSSHVKI